MSDKQNQASDNIVIDRHRLDALMKREEARFVADHPRSLALFERAKHSLHGGVPMVWMRRWAGGFPVFIEEASGARFTDVDGKGYVDFCLGDTGAMTGHAPAAATEVIARQAGRGITAMLPTEDAVWVGEELTRRFGLPYWQFSLSATDANRSAIRLARFLTGRPKILVFNWCYHGTVDDTLVTLQDGVTVPRPGNIGAPVDPSVTTVVVEFNDVSALETALASGEVACVLAEPAMTNIGIIHPQPDFHHQLRELTRKYDTLLIIDETHTISAGYGGYTRAYGLEPDMLTIGKPIASGVPSATFGMSEEVAGRVSARLDLQTCDTSGLGGTLAGNALSLAAMRVTLEQVLTADAFEGMIQLGEQFAAGVEGVIARYRLPWHATRLGCRVEYLFQPDRPIHGSQAASLWDHDLDAFMHLYLLNRGILMTPFHNMALISPATTEEDVELHTVIFDQAVCELLELDAEDVQL